MAFTCIVLFLGLYYLKPQEWTSLFATIRFVQLTMFASLGSLLLRGRGLKAADLLRTPHDWAMLAFFAWVVVASPTPFDTFKEFLNRIVFYVVIVQTLTHWDLAKRFLGWWTAIVVSVAALALVSEYIVDPLNSQHLTHGIMKDRLVLNLSMVNNPNALGHTVVPAIPMLYYFCIWKRPIFIKQIGLATFILPLWCVYLTFSKGAYLAGAITILATLTFGRPKFVQIALLAIAMIAGATAVETLPRMNELRKTKTDEAIQGRIKAFTHGWSYYEDLNRGVGQGKFIDSLLRDHSYYKAAHSTYVQTGAELGRPGLYLFLLLVWVSARTLLFAKTETPEQERVRRILFVLLLTYCVSGWMVDFAYRATFFMFVGAIAAFHRLHYLRAEQPADGSEDSSSSGTWRRPVPTPELVPDRPLLLQAAVVVGAPDSSSRADMSKPWLRATHAEEPVPADPNAPPTAWNRLGWVDLAVAGAILYTTERFWTYAIKNF